MVGGVGQRMLTIVSKRMAGEFFGNVGRLATGSRGRGDEAGHPSHRAAAEPASRAGQVSHGARRGAGGIGVARTIPEG